MRSSPGRLLRDPRLTQCAVSAQGVALTVDASDMRRAEASGDIEKPSPLVLEDMVEADRCGTAEESKALGTAAHAAGAHARALAFWARSLRFNREAGVPDDPAFAAAVYANAAQALLKLGHPGRAAQAATRAVANADAALERQAREDAARRAAALFAAEGEEVAPPSEGEGEKLRSVRRRALYRRGLAREAVRDFAGAHGDLEAALASAADGERAVIARDAARVAKLRRGDDAARTEREARRAEDKALAAARAAGVALKKKGGGEREGHSSLNAALGYLDERDFSSWALQRLGELLAKDGDLDLGGGAYVAFAGLLAAQSSVSATVTLKRGQRALYYDIDAHARWTAEPAPVYDLADDRPAAASSGRTLRGVIRLYNVSHETRFEPGADPNVAYMYQVGYEGLQPGWCDGQAATPDAPDWARTLINGAHELYDRFARVADELIAELRAKLD